MTAVWQAAIPDMAPGGQASAYLPMRIMPSGLQPLLMASFFINLLPSGVAMFSPALASALTAGVMSPTTMPWTFAAFVLLSEGAMMLVSSKSQAHDFADWMNGVRTQSSNPKDFQGLDTWALEQSICELQRVGQCSCAGCKHPRHVSGKPELAGRAQIDAGIRGLSPGAATEAFLLQQQRLVRFWGCLALAGLALASHLLDNVCTALLGAPLGCLSLLLLAGFLLSTERQVR